MKFYKFVGAAVLMTIIEHGAAAGLPEKLLAMPITLTTGEVTSLADFKGKKPVYLKFWATWCQPCLKEMPHFEHVEQQYGNDIKVIGINLGMNETLEDVTAIEKKFSLTMAMAIDKSGDLAQAFRLLGTPYHLLFDKQMNLVHVGNVADESLDNKLALVAKETPIDLLSADIIKEVEQDLLLDSHDEKIQALYFTATWCDWYLKDSRPEISKRCVRGQAQMNTLVTDFPQVSWQGIAARLWTANKDLIEYQNKFKPLHGFRIDQSNQLFHKYNVKQFPTLIILKKGKVILKAVGDIKRAQIEKTLGALQ